MSTTYYKNARKTRLGALVFDSAGEAARWQELLLMERAGTIENLRRQVKFTLIPAGVDACGRKFRALTYAPDFQYRVIGDKLDTVEDYKGHVTAVYKIKRKIFQAHFPHLQFVESGPAAELHP